MRMVRPSQRRLMMTAGMMSTRHCQLKAHQAFERAFGLSARMWIDLGLALLAQIAGGELGERAAFDGLLAALLDESAEHRRLAILGRQVDAIPLLAAVAGVEEVTQQIGLLAIA